MSRLPWYASILFALSGLSALVLSLEQRPSSASSPNSPLRNKTISAPGEVRLKGKTTIVDKPANITRTLIRPGDQVQAGQVIFLLSSYHPTMAKLQTSLVNFPLNQDWQEQVATSKVRSPISGLVFRLEPIVEIGDLKDLEIIAYLNAEEVRIGQVMTILSHQRELLAEVTEIRSDYVLLQLKEPESALILLDQQFKVKVIDNYTSTSYN